jgi:hypothetical protein
MNEPFSASERMENTLKSVQEAQTPLLRVNLFGEFQIAWQVQPFTQEAAWDRRTSARALFKLLWSSARCHEYCACLTLAPRFICDRLI